VTPAKGSLISETTSLPQNETHAQAQNEVDLVLHSFAVTIKHLYSDLRFMLCT